MQRLTNEKGYALLFVMLLVVLFTILGLGLLLMNANASKQFSLKEDQVQARHYAEMGLLHYQALVEETVELYKFTATQTGATTALAKSRQELCTKIKNIGSIQKSGNGSTYKVPSAGLTGCSTGDSGKITVTMKSTGIAESGTTKLVEGSMEVTPPTIVVTEVNPATGPAIPAKPMNTTGQAPITSYPPSGDVKGFVEIDGPFPIQRTSYHFESFIINSLPSNNALLAGGGNSGDTLKIEKDLYIGGGVYSNNFICIYVQGNLTILGNVNLGPYSLILVYGDAYIKGSITTNPNAKIHVIGNTYIGASKTLTTAYKSFPGYTKSCESIVTWPDPVEVAQTGKVYNWSLNNKLNTIYH
ncbi:hypothetical protein [Planococcus sp. 4-30]|uniref:hypothetical protein n=1 Tax=Planococcus sp. 4-30 TaxID=2874583 RepID=UPI001CBCF97B|nr:hypothetical protein [Planococcus sp. 4-30]